MDRLIVGTSGSPGSLQALRYGEKPGPRGLEPEDLTPQMREEFIELYRRWRSEQQ